MSNPTQPNIRLTNLALRDGQQSTLDGKDWVMDTAKMAKVIVASKTAGFESVEVAGGQSFQTAISNGYNPFAIADALSNATKDADGNKTIELQMLFRGANALGFRHYDKDVVEATLNEFIKNGVSKIRFFDALNDIDNLDLPESIKAKEGLVLQGAACFGGYKDAPERYTDDYFAAYVRALVAKGFNSIAIKDMSGQMTAERMATLLPTLQAILTPAGIPLELHLHSTNSTTSREAIAKAVELGIDSIETVEGPLAGGSAHHDLRTVAPGLIPLPTEYEQLQAVSRRIWSDTPSRKDTPIPVDLRAKLCDAGVPGGAMPFVIRDLTNQQPTIVGKYRDIQKRELAKTNKFNVNMINMPRSAAPEEISFDDVVELFIAELRQVCQDAGLPLLVTPTADICCKQAIRNLAFGKNPYGDSLSDRYLHATGDTGADVRFVKLVLGHYGEFKGYDAKQTVFRPAENVIAFFEQYNPQGLKRTTNHPSTSPSGNDMDTARAAAWDLIHAKSQQALSFANFDQLTLMYALKPTTAPGVDPIAKAVDAYANRAESFKINGQGVTFPGYETIMQPILEHLGALFAVDPSRDANAVMQTKLGELGNNLYRRLFRTYATLPITQEVTRVTNTLTNLISSDHTSYDLMAAVDFVGRSFRNLDLRPKEQAISSYEHAREEFRKKTIADIFNSLAVTHSLVNSVDKYGTNPKAPAERPITLHDLQRYAEDPSYSPTSKWERHLAGSVRARHLTVANDLKRRIKEWI